MRGSKALIRVRAAAVLLAALLAALLAGCGPSQEPGAAPDELDSPVSAQLDPANWYPGDAHDHCDYSKLAFYEEGLVPLPELAEAAFGGEDPLAWLVLTDHGPQLGMEGGLATAYSAEHGRARFEEERAEALELERSGAAGCLLVGEELGTVTSGHFAAYDIDGYVVDSAWDNGEEGFIRRVGEAGGFGFIAHPRQRKGGVTFWHWPGFERYISGITADSTLRGFEVLSGVHVNPEQMGLLEAWDRALAAGVPVLVTGVSDAHTPQEVGRFARTYVFVDKGGAPLDGGDHAAVLDALRRGRSVASNGPRAVCYAVNRRTGQGAGPGEYLAVSPGDEVTVHTACAAAACTGLKLVSDLPGADLVKDPGAVFNLSIPAPADRNGHYLRLEGFGPGGACYANPVFLAY